MPDLPRLQSVLHLDFSLRALTGLRIGGSEAGLVIGGSDNPVIRDPLTSRPYVPGSSLKGKMRSLLERRYGRQQNQSIDQVLIHICTAENDYRQCPVCPLFGIPAHKASWFCLTRLRFPDVQLSPRSAEELAAASLDLPFTEMKTEVAIDRLTSAASPRNVERVPAGAVFGPGRISLFLYEGDSPALLEGLVEGLDLLEADYLGGMGARGSGRVVFEDLSLSSLHLPATGPAAARVFEAVYPNCKDLRAALPAIVRWAEQD